MNWKLKLVLFFSKINPPFGNAASTSIDTIRINAKRAAKLGSIVFDKKESVAETEDIALTNFSIRIYKPSSLTNLPVMIYYHGGGFVLYDIDSHDLVCRRLCKMNDCIVVSVDYRLAPEFTFPTAHIDAWDAVLWVKKNIQNYGGDIDKLVLAGDSAGGNLAACMAHKSRDEGVDIKAQILIYPWVDGKINLPSIDRNGDGYMLTKAKIKWFQNQYTPNPEDHCNPLVSPYYAENFKNLAPAFIATAEFDPLLDDGFVYSQKIKEASVIIFYKEYQGLIHSFFNLPLVSKEAMECYTDIQTFLKDRLR